MNRDIFNSIGNRLGMTEGLQQMAAVFDAVGTAAGIGGIGLLVALFIIRTLVSKMTLPTPTKRQAFYLLNFGFVLAALAMILGVAAYCLPMFLKSSERNVEIRIRDNAGILISKTFKVAYVIPQRGARWDEGKDGHVTIRGVPSNLDSLDISDVACAGFEMKSSPPFVIANDVVDIRMIEAMPPIPWEKDNLPNPIEDLPTQARATAAPRIHPDQVTLLYRNDSGDDLWLLMYDAAKHYDSNPDPNIFRTRWYQREFPASDQWKIFDRFDGGTGWFVFFVCNDQKQCQFLATQDIFDTNTPQLVVSKQFESGKYVGKFNFVSQ